MASHFRSLDVYVLAARLADELHAAVREWPRLRPVVGRPAARPGGGPVGANIAEAAGRWTKADKRNFPMIARGSLYETEHWLERANARGLLATDMNDLRRRDSPHPERPDQRLRPEPAAAPQLSPASRRHLQSASCTAIASQPLTAI